MAAKTTVIVSMRDFEQRARSLAEAINGAPQLALRAAVNPLLALEELGYSFAAELRPSVERRLRFSPAIFKQIDDLALKISQIAGRPVDLDSPVDLAQLLFQELKLPAPSRTLAQQAHPALLPTNLTGLATDPLPPQIGESAKLKDPLEELSGKHPIIAPLLEYRRLDASEPRFATVELYDQVKAGKIKLPITRLMVRVH